jgi:potassium-transporting ATPase KdpC subunit
MKKSFITSLRMILILTVITGLAYPLLVTGISQAFFHKKAQGSQVEKNGIIVGSELLGQRFDSAAYFWPRPSVINYQPIPSGASNLSWTDKSLKEKVDERKEAFLKGNLLSDSISVPVEMLFASGSGLDPHISPEAAFLQAERVAKSRGFNSEQKQMLVSLITKMTEKRQYSIFGEDRINVFLLNLELDKIR